MLWVVRGTDPWTQQDVSIVVEAQERVQAECMGWKRGIPVAFVGPATEDDVKTAKEAKLLWKYTPDPRYTFFGQPVSLRQLDLLMLCGCSVILLLLRASHVPMNLMFWA